MRTEPQPYPIDAEGPNPAKPDTAPEPLPGPRRVKSLRSRRSSLADPSAQQRLLAELELLTPANEKANFEAAIAAHGWQGLHPGKLEVFQINLGKLCNMSCRHCHVDAGPDRWDQMMDKETIDACLKALDQTQAHTVDLTGGAPEMNPHFRFVVEEAILRGKQVIDRCNLTILLVPKFFDLPEWLADRGVELVCSLPHYRPRNTEAQRGEGTFEKSIEALRRLNSVGYGKGNPRQKLSLVANPAGAFLAGNQCALEAEWKKALSREQGVTFDHLITLNNMPISRFLEWLQESENLLPYLEKLVYSFNPQTIAGLMCRNTISVSWDGRIFDCDFNQMLEISAEGQNGSAPHISKFDPEHFAQRRIRTARHCFGCTAGAGSSCRGALVE
jgi:radical SAM/Cys-rich protein